jgi:hypothetical protein
LVTGMADALVDGAADFAPIVCATGMFMYDAATAVAIVSNRSPTLMTTSGFR